MPAITCACGQPVNDAYLCRDCTQQLTTDLLVAATMGPELDTARSKQARFSEHHGSGTYSHPLPYDVRAAEVADELAMVLARWVRELSP